MTLQGGFPHYIRTGFLCLLLLIGMHGFLGLDTYLFALVWFFRRSSHFWMSTVLLVLLVAA
jgi:hypothetical protein